MGSTHYCFTDVGIHINDTPITKGTPAQIFLGCMFLVPYTLAFDFCYDLDFCSQGQEVRKFFDENGFFPHFVKSTRNFDQTCQKTS